MNKLVIYIKSILVPVILGILVGSITSNYIDYENLIQPKFAPPSFLFPIVCYGILKSKNLNTKTTDTIYYIQLGVNALWSIFFFIFKLRLFSFFWIVLLILLVVYMIREFYSKDKISGLLQIPYLLWIIFASILNLSVYFLNI